MKKFERFLKIFAPAIIEKFVSDKKDLFRNSRYVFDGLKNLYTVKMLDFQDSFTSEVTVDINEIPKKFELRLAWVGQVELSKVLDFYQGNTDDLSEQTVSIFDIVFRFMLGKEYAVFQRKHFDLSSASQSPKFKYVDFVSGFISSVRMTQFGLALNVHLKTSTIISKTISKLYELVNKSSNICDGVRPELYQLDKANKIARHLKIFTVHTRRGKLPYIIEEIIPETPDDHFIPETQETIADYFLRAYQIEVMQLPLVRARLNKRVDFLPMELCLLGPNQFLNNTKIDTNIQRELLFKSTHIPTVYFNKLGAIVDKVALIDSDLQSQFGIELTLKPVALKGRVLPKPETLNFRDKFYEAKNAPAKWAVFCFDPTIQPEDLTSFIKRMMSRANFFGMRFFPPNPCSKFAVQNKEGLEIAFDRLHSETQAEFIFVGLLEGHQLELYNLTKHYCDQRYGIMSQCFKSKYVKITDTPSGYFDNLLEKVNGKLGGANCVINPTLLENLPFNRARTMLVGIDVNHPGVTEKVESSISAAVGSYDSLFTKYSASLRAQPKEGQEIIKQINQMIFELLAEYKKNNNKNYPQNLIIFRDGVSEGMFEKVENIEIGLIQSVFKKIGQKFKLTYIVTQKRHHTRFVLAKEAKGHKSTFNVPSGTVVDTTIVEPNLKVFYLNSHFSPLGTSKPTKYIILRDDLNLSTDDIQKLCFYACYNSTRTRKVISIPTPVRYADLCAYRAKLHVEAQNRLGNDSELEIIIRLNHHIKVFETFKNRFYYC